MMLIIKGLIIDTAGELEQVLTEQGIAGEPMNKCDIEELRAILGKTDEAARMEYERDIYKEERDQFESTLDSYSSALTEIVNLIDEYTEAQRITKAREKLETIAALCNRCI